MQIVLTGASGFLGRFLSRRLAAEGHTVRPMVRVARAAGVEGAISWDPDDGTLDPSALAGVDAVIHLAGEPIAQRWTRERKRRIRDSRVRGTETLARAIAASRRPGLVFLSGSAIGVYGNRGDEALDERSGAGSDFLASVATEWERATDSARAAGARVIQLRTGIVLAARGGALAKMLPAFRVGLGGPIGSGRQWMSWIACEDFGRAVLFLLDAAEAAGPVNLVAPHPIRNAEFARVLGRTLHRPAIVPVPGAALMLALGEMGRSTVLASQRVLPQRLLALGFQFRLPLLGDALAFELGRGD
ncbi:MAG: TIGR01777 family oxidoreductase [Gemmatimonadaceae bacterium]